MFCPDFCCLLEDFSADDWLVGVGNDYPTIFRNHGRLPGFMVHNLRFQQDQIAGVNRIVLAPGGNSHFRPGENRQF